MTTQLVASMHHIGTYDAYTLYRNDAGAYVLTQDGILTTPETKLECGWYGDNGSAWVPANDDDAIARLHTLGPVTANQMAENYMAQSAPYLMTESELMAQSLDDLPGVQVIPDSIAAVISVNTDILPSKLIQQFLPVPAIDSVIDSAADHAIDWERLIAAAQAFSGAITTMRDRVATSVAPIAPSAPTVPQTVGDRPAYPYVGIKFDPTLKDLIYHLVIGDSEVMPEDEAIAVRDRIVAASYARAPKDPLEVTDAKTAPETFRWLCINVGQSTGIRFIAGCDGRFTTF